MSACLSYTAEAPPANKKRCGPKDRRTTWPVRHTQRPRRQASYTMRSRAAHKQAGESRRPMDAGLHVAQALSAG